VGVDSRGSYDGGVSVFGGHDVDWGWGTLGIGQDGHVGDVRAGGDEGRGEDDVVVQCSFLGGGGVYTAGGGWQKRGGGGGRGEGRWRFCRTLLARFGRTVTCEGGGCAEVRI
jgi:hypothetical protein